MSGLDIKEFSACLQSIKAQFEAARVTSRYMQLSEGSNKHHALNFRTLFNDELYIIKETALSTDELPAIIIYRYNEYDYTSTHPDVNSYILVTGKEKIQEVIKHCIITVLKENKQLDFSQISMHVLFEDPSTGEW